MRRPPEASRGVSRGAAAHRSLGSAAEEAAGRSRTIRNRLLCGIAGEERERLLRGARLRHFLRGEMLLEPNRPIERVVFPETMLASLIITMTDGATAEVAGIGYEGVVGLSSLLGATTTWSAVCQIAGDGYVVPVDAFRRAAEVPQFRERLGLYTNALLAQMAQAVACNRLHSVERRAARWLLLSRDRMRRPEFNLTQEFLATMLGVSRPTVAAVAAQFARHGWAEFQHGVVAIYDSHGLEGAACECYAVMRDEFRRMDGVADCSRDPLVTPR